MLRSIGSVTLLALFMVGCGGGDGIPTGIDDGSGGGGGASNSPQPPPPNWYTVGGTVSGLVGSGLTLAICTVHGGGPGLHIPSCHNLQQVSANGTYILDSVYPVDYLSHDSVSITQQPSSPPQRCVISNADVSAFRPPVTPASRWPVRIIPYLYVTNAADNTVSSYSVDATTGALQSSAHRLPRAHPLTQSSVPRFRGSGYVFVGNEGSNDVSAFAVDPTTGALTAVPGSPFAAGTDPQAMAVFLGSSLFVANAGSDNVSVYPIDPNTGALGAPSTAATAKSPTSIIIDPEGSQMYVANHGGSNDISEILGQTAVPGSPFPAGGNPLSLALGANGKFLYSANPDATNPSISGFSVDAGIGVLSPLSGSPFPIPVSHYIATDQTGAYLYVTSGSERRRLWHRRDHRCAYAAAGVPGSDRRERLFDNHRSDQPVPLCHQ